MAGSALARPFPDGVLVVDKPARLSSFDVIRRLKPLLGRRKAGFVGTLDPFATGVLPLCIGEATKLADALGEGSKEYVATLSLGTATDTGDVTGREVRSAEVPPADRESLARIAALFRGEIAQTPPMYSALHVDGERLYEKARRGEVVDRPPRLITVFELDLDWTREREIRLRAVCSKGTYVRVLGEDLARALGTEGHLSSLRRTRSGQLGVDRAGTLDDILASPDTAFGSFGVAIDSLLEDWPALRLDDSGAKSVSHGAAVRRHQIVDGLGTLGTRTRVRLVHEGRLLALGTVEEGAGLQVRPIRVLVRERD